MQQTTINFARSEQLGLIRGAELPAVGNIKPDKLKAVLRAIDDHAGQYGWCFATQATIAREVCMPTRTVERAIGVLRDRLGVILTELRQSPGGTVVNHTRIVWTELALLCEPHRARRESASLNENETADLGTQSANTGGSVPDDRSAKTDDRSAKTDDRSAKTDDRSANSGGTNRKRLGSAQEAPPPPTPSESDWAAAAEALGGLGVRMVSRAVLDARERGHQPADVLAWCDEFRRWSHRFSGPAAIVWRIREGCWPVELPDRQTVEAIAERASSAASEREHGRRFREIVLRSRKARLPDDEIRRQLRAELPGEFLDSQGW